MPNVSVVIPAYNVAPYAKACVKSALDQSGVSVEVIVVDDASTDDTADIVAAMAAVDPRVILVRLEKNRGQHFCRILGTSHSTGERVLYLDGDDELSPDVLSRLVSKATEEDVDVVHFGCVVVPEGVATPAQASFLQRSFNSHCECLVGEDLARAVFFDEGGHRLDWNVTKRLFAGDIVRAAFREMTDERLSWGEDAYEFFAILSKGLRHASLDDCLGYIYHYGRGSTTQDKMSVEKFEDICGRVRATDDAVARFASAHPFPGSVLASEGFAHRHVELLSDCWHDEVAREDQGRAAHIFGETLGEKVAAREIWRFTRDRAYSIFSSGDVPAKDDVLFEWMGIAERLDAAEPAEADDPAAPADLADIRQAALNHLADLERRRQCYESFGDTRLSIFVTDHKNAVHPKASMFEVVQVGPGVKTNRFPDTHHDDDGKDNISEKNPMYCELTTQYWAWKNVDLDYYGFCHYRRYFNFGVEAEENPCGEIDDGAISPFICDRYQLTNEGIIEAVKGYDIVTTGFNDVSTFPGEFVDMRDHWVRAPHLRPADLELMEKILAERQPDYVQDADEYLSGSVSCFCNMYIMRADLFRSYCSWLFPLLDEWVERSDLSRVGRETLRTPGHLSERLFNIWYLHLMRTVPETKAKQVQCVHFSHPEKAVALAPVEVDECLGAPIPVVLAANDDYAPFLSAAVRSIAENASPSRLYDIVVLNTDITPDHQRELAGDIAEFRNVGLRFFDVARYLAGRNLITNNEHISVETYFRFMIQDVLPFYDKVIYLDCDLVVEDDVAKLFDCELGRDLIAATRDIDYLGNLNGDGTRMEYSRGVLHMTDPYDYFQAGVLVINEREMRLLHSVDDWMRLASDSPFIYDDQDVLNSECQGRVHYLDQAWNIMTDTYDRVPRIFVDAPVEYYDAYVRARRNPKAIHFAGGIKPWNEPQSDLAPRFWYYSRHTCFYERAIHHLASIAAWHNIDDFCAGHPYPIVPPPYVPPPTKGQRIKTGIKEASTVVAPVGSPRRKALKSLYRKMKGIEDGQDTGDAHDDDGDVNDDEA